MYSRYRNKWGQCSEWMFQIEKERTFGYTHNHMLKIFHRWETWKWMDTEWKGQGLANFKRKRLSHFIITLKHNARCYSIFKFSYLNIYLYSYTHTNKKSFDISHFCVGIKRWLQVKWKIKNIYEIVDINFILLWMCFMNESLI